MSIRFEQQHRWNERPFADVPGVYAYFVIRSTGIPLLPPDHLNPIYVGMTKNSLNGRSHFEYKNSGSSSLRRSLGAILKHQLSLRAVPRSSRASKKDFQNYAFADCGEERLTEWMRANLAYSHQPLEANVCEHEKATIAALRPILNLDRWPNPDRKHIMRLRADCVQEAREGR